MQLVSVCPCLFETPYMSSLFPTIRYVAQEFEELIAELIGVLNPSLPGTTKDDFDGEIEIAFRNHIRRF